MRGILLFVALCLAARCATAAFVPDPARRNADLPPDRTGPVPVTVDFFLLDVTAVNGAAETFSASLYFDVTWKDSRLAFDAAAFGSNRVLFTGSSIDEQLSRMWSPEITPSNLTGDPQVIDRSLTISSDGTVEYETRIAGEFSSDMELSRFPFDTQRLSVRLESFLWKSDELQLVAVRSPRHVNENLVIRDWRLVSVSSDVDDEQYVTGDGYSRFTSTIVVERNPWFYIWSVLFPLVLVTFFAMLCFFWDQETLSERIAQVLTCLLTVTAQSLAVNGDLPKISYFTRIDYAFLLTYAVLLAVALESIFAKFLNQRNSVLADRIDYRSAWIVGAAYAVGLTAVLVIP